MSVHEHKHLTAEAYGVNKKALAFALSITTLMMLVEFVGGLLSGSLALLSDAGHMLTDTGALALALFALWFSRKPATAEKTYGFYRSEILAALLNGTLLIVIAGYIFYEAIQRFINPLEVQSLLMLSVAVVGLLANLVGAFILSKGSRENLNVKAALWHIISDAFSSVGVILGGIIIYFTKLFVVDPIIGFIIGIMILRGAWGLIRESVDVLLEATPKEINLEEVMIAVKKIEGVRDLHDVHIWTITSGLYALSGHLLIDDRLVSAANELLGKVNKLLLEEFKIQHATIQLECEACDDRLVCRLR